MRSAQQMRFFQIKKSVRHIIKRRMRMGTIIDIAMQFATAPYDEHDKAPDILAKLKSPDAICAQFIKTAERCTYLGGAGKALKSEIGHLWYPPKCIRGLNTAIYFGLRPRLEAYMAWSALASAWTGSSPGSKI